MKAQRIIAKITLATVAFTLCGVPQVLQAQSSQTAPPQTQQETPAPSQPAAPAQTDAQGATATTPEATERQNTADAQSAPAAQSSAQQQSPTQPQGSTGIVDPSKGPLTPVPSSSEELPNAPSATQGTNQTQATPQAAPIQAPAGAAAAQTGPTAGGAASKPAGNAIAPAKQRQVRSLLIKLGAIAAAGAAIGTVVALSKGSPSTPPGAR